MARSKWEVVDGNLEHEKGNALVVQHYVLLRLHPFAIWLPLLTVISALGGAS